MIVISGSLLGFYYASDIQKRYDELYLWKKNFQMIYGDISYGGVTFLEVLHRVEVHNRIEYKEFFSYVLEEMSSCRKRKFGEIWSEGIAVHLQKSHLNSLDKEELKFIGEHMGNVDKEQQLAMIQMYLNKVETAITQLEGEKERRMRLYRMLGVLGSIFVVVLFL